MPPQLTSHLEPLQGRSSPTGVGFRRPEALEGGGQLEGPPPPAERGSAGWTGPEQNLKLLPHTENQPRDPPAWADRGRTCS